MPSAPVGLSQWPLRNLRKLNKAQTIECSEDNMYTSVIRRFTTAAFLFPERVMIASKSASRINRRNKWKPRVLPAVTSKTPFRDNSLTEPGVRSNKLGSKAFNMRVIMVRSSTCEDSSRRFAISLPSLVSALCRSAASSSTAWTPPWPPSPASTSSDSAQDKSELEPPKRRKRLAETVVSTAPRNLLLRHSDGWCNPERLNMAPRRRVGGGAKSTTT
mmetsp:Transcript_22840/g.65921  ORF Transcript_22840/g.65921 Transcript_22840/m.65921 type:complete len:217 (+) Transcript_22840:1665-2315(+)